MPNESCAVYKCSNATNKIYKLKKQDCSIHSGKKRENCGCELPYTHHRFPDDKDLKEKWIQLINRQTKDGSIWIPRNTSVVCSDHFIDGRPTPAHPLPTMNLNYTPTNSKTVNRKPPLTRLGSLAGHGESSFSSSTRESVKPPVEKEQLDTNQSIDETEPYELGSGSLITVKREIEVIENIVKSSPTKTKTKQSQSIKRLQHKLFAQRFANQHLKKRLKALDIPLHSKLLTSDDQCRFYTCLPTVQHFNLLCDMFTKSIKYHKRHQMKITPSIISTKIFKRSFTLGQSINKANRYSPLNTKDEVLLVLMKLRLNLMHKDLADRFNISLANVSTVFRKTLADLRIALTPLIIFYTREEVKKTIAPEHRAFPRLRCIIDCAEVFLQKPSDLEIQSATWSDYKHHNTLKFLVGCTPQGSICYVSEMWGGRASDRHIVTNSNFLNFIRPKDQVLADRGFTIADELSQRRAELVIPPAGRGRSQHTAAETSKTKQVANVRIHIERVIRNLKLFKVLSTQMPISLAPLANDILFVCAAITNMGRPIVKHWTSD